MRRPEPSARQPLRAGCLAGVLIAAIGTASAQPPAPPTAEPDDLPPYSPGTTVTSPALTPPAAARPTPRRSQRALESFAILVEQDVLLEWTPGAGDLNEDRNYSMGMALHAQGTVVASCWFLAPPALRALDHVVGLARRHTDHRFANGIESTSLTLGHSAFTPDDLGQTATIPGDRPYASLLYLTAARLSVAADGAFALRTDFTIGALGMPIARPAQAWIHERLRGDGTTPKDPLGWPHQISAGGEPTLRYGAAGRWLVLDTASWLDLSVLGELNVGTYTNVAGGITLRVGVRRTPFWGFDSNPLGYSNQVAGEARPARMDAYLFVGVRERAVAYNALLEGQFRHSDLRVRAADVERVISEGEMGIVLGWPGVVTLTWTALAGRTPEYEGVGERPHLWASMYLTFGGAR